MSKESSTIPAAVSIRWMQYLSIHNERDPCPRVEIGAIRSRKPEPSVFFTGPSLLDRLAGIRQRILHPGPFPVPVAHERVIGPPPEEAETAPEMLFIEGLDCFIVELTEGARRTLREIGPVHREDLFRAVYGFTRNGSGEALPGRTGRAFVDARERLPDGSRVFAEILGISETSRHSYRLGSLRAFGLDELPERLPEPGDYAEIMAAAQAIEDARQAAIAKTRDTAGYSIPEIMADRKQERDRLARQADLDRAVEAALAKKEKALA